MFCKDAGKTPMISASGVITEQVFDLDRSHTRSWLHLPYATAFCSETYQKLTIWLKSGRIAERKQLAFAGKNVFMEASNE